jgi:pilus assembly protein CpaF
MAERKVNLGPIESLMADPEVSEIMVNGPDKIFMEKGGKKILSEAKLGSEEDVLGLAQKLFGEMGKRVAVDVPFADVCLEDGTRVNAILPPLSRFGTSITFRKFSKAINTLDDLIANATLTQNAADLLVACVRGKINMVFSGGTATGKTTLLQMLSNYFDPKERVITIEDAAELRMGQENVISLETRTPDREGKGGVYIRDLIRNALRMAPDRLVVGEVRGEEAVDMFQAMATGHSGTIGVVHGNTPKDVLARMETMILMSGIKLPLADVRRIIASTLQVIVHMERMRDGSRKVTYITEIRGIEREEFALNDLFKFNFEGLDENGKVKGKLKSAIKYYPAFFQRFQQIGLLTENVFAKE